MCGWRGEKRVTSGQATVDCVEHREGADVPAWLLDTDYNGLCFHVCQAFFPRTAAWDDPALSGDPKARAFRVQLEHVTPMPRVPEWEQIAQKLVEDLEPAVRGRESVAKGLARLDADVDRILEKRRWMLARKR